MSRGASCSLVFFFLFVSSFPVESQTLSGDSSIFGHLKETHTAEFSGDRSVKIIEDKIFLYNRNDSINRVEVLDVPTLKSIWSLSGSYFYIQSSEGKHTYAILYSASPESPTIEVYELTGERLFTLPNYDGGILATPNGEVFYPSDYGYNGTEMKFHNKNGNTIAGNISGYGFEPTARSLNDTVLVVAHYKAANIFTITQGHFFDSIMNPMIGAGAKMARSKFGGHVLLNRWRETYYVDSTMKFKKIQDAPISAQIVQMSPDGKLGFLFVLGPELCVVAYRLFDLQRIWKETIEIEQGNRLDNIELISLEEFICILLLEHGSREENRISTIKSFVIRLDPISGQQIEKIDFAGTVRIGSLGTDVFSVESELIDNKTIVTLKLWE
ncbi:MAG TPA: hypothetical protein VHP63_01530 [candidate division Zixibacteria bacterium]|nr:hypothetical protein [candidate division Zixibacteria bacterium]